jgi:hypothetical protein
MWMTEEYSPKGRMRMRIIEYTLYGGAKSSKVSSAKSLPVDIPSCTMSNIRMFKMQFLKSLLLANVVFFPRARGPVKKPCEITCFLVV